MTLTDPLLAALSDRDGVRTISVPPFSWTRFPEWQKVWADVRGCDTLLWVQQRGLRPDAEIHLAALLKLALRRSAYFIDPFKHQIGKIGYFAATHRLDPCFLGWAEPVDDLQSRFSHTKFEWLPFAAHTDVFYPRPEGKSVFIFWMGRRDEHLHNALLTYCKQRDLQYVYSNDMLYSLEQLGRIASSAQYFVVTPTGARRSGGYSPLVARYFEGLAAGTRLLGVLPTSGEYERLLPVDAICQVAPDGSDLTQKLDEDRRNTEAQRFVDLACAFVHKHHSWRRRAEQIYNRLAHGAELEFPSPMRSRY
jgi:hypothetical protein